jgi:hypothetical protein
MTGVVRPVYRPVYEDNLGLNGMGTATVLRVRTYREVRSWYAALSITILERGFDDVNLSTTEVTRWAGQVGASFLSASVSYNGWAALDSAPVWVVSFGGHTGSCYMPRFALGFIPLLLAALVVT